MVKISTSPQLHEVELLKGMLEQHDIACVIRNEALANTAGRHYGLPELWVLHDTNATRAMQLIDEWQSADNDEAAMWTCANCGERHEGQFDSCWNCGKSRPQ
jgi:hypothetical protein